MNFIFILVKPAIPENIGASARAIKTMGFDDLRIVDSEKHLDPKTKILAHGSTDIVDNIKHFNSLEEAISDIDFIIAATARKRTRLTDYHTIEDTVEIVEKKRKSIKSVGIVFGSEESGLSNADIQLCDMLSTISLKKPYPSLNLSQAVMIYAYAFSKFIDKKSPKQKDTKNADSWKVLQKNISQLLIEVDINPSDLIYTRIMERVALLGDTDINLLHSVIAAINKKLSDE
ncbi:MAG: tRNA/rRNA methyltransferase [Lentimicrobiaceae bacterium]|nr:tRNA/rRNA methyltransferase [Lentimicrobiaceae bacterium]